VEITKLVLRIGFFAEEGCVAFVVGRVVDVDLIEGPVIYGRNKRGAMMNIRNLHLDGIRKGEEVLGGFQRLFDDICGDAVVLDCRKSEFVI
jgi:hypothetical protein